MNTRMVKITSMVNKTVGVKRPELGINRKWTQKGQVMPIPYDIVEQLLWTEGFRNMIDRGILYIDDLQDKIDLGLEPYDAKEPQNIIVLTDIQIANLLKNVPFVAFKQEISKLGITQIKEIVNYAILHEVVDVQKADLLRQITGTDILKRISFNKDMNEAEKH